MTTQHDSRHGSRGQTLALFAVVLIGLMWVMALGVDAAQMMLRQREMQSVADLATLAGARSLAEGSGDASSRACAVAIANGYTCPGEAVVTFPATGQIQVTVGAPVETFFLRIFGVATVDASALARAAGMPEVAGGYAIFAGRTGCASGSELNLDWSGSTTTVIGAVHSNGGIKMGGSDNSVIGDTTYACAGRFQGPGSNDFTPPAVIGPSLSYPHPPSGYTTADFPCTVGSHTGPEIDVGASGSHYISPGVLRPGVWCSGALIKLGVSSVTGNITFVANKIDISGSSSTLVAHTNSVLFWARGSGDDAMKLAGSNINWTGIVYAPNGQIEYSGSTNNTLAGSLIGQRVKLNGGTLTIDATGFGDPIPGEIRLVE